MVDEPALNRSTDLPPGGEDYRFRLEKPWNDTRNEKLTPALKPGASACRLNNAGILVLGMHRSGTSAVSGVLQRIGVELGSHLLSNLSDNPKGHYEHKDVLAVHEELLGALGSRWDDPRHLPHNWTERPDVAPYRERLRAILLRDFKGKALWGVKDPRLCSFLPLWRPLLEELGVDAKALIVLRSPAEVALSLHKRNGMPAAQALSLWLGSIISAERETRDLPRAVISYSHLLHDWKGEIKRAFEKIGIPLPSISDKVEKDVEAFLTQDLRHHAQAGLDSITAIQKSWAERAYRALESWRTEGKEPGPVLDEIGDALLAVEVAAQPIQQFLSSAFESTLKQLRAELDLAKNQLADAYAQIAAAYAPPGANANRIILKPLHDLKPVGPERWRACGNDPWFIVEGKDRPSGFCRLRAEIEVERSGATAHGALISRLHPDDGSGFRKEDAIECELQGNKLDALVFIPSRTRLLRFSPIGFPCEFKLTDFQLSIWRCEVKPLRDLKALAEGGWESAGNGPQLLFEAEHFPRGQYYLEGEIERISGDNRNSDGTDSAWKICLDKGNGFSEEGEIDVEWPGTGKMSGIVQIPDGVARFRLDHFPAAGSVFRYSGFTLIPFHET